MERIESQRIVTALDNNRKVKICLLLFLAFSI
jgi:hypothetical protein